MRLDGAARLLTSWIAVLAILVAALVPLKSYALFSKTGTSWVEICTSLGAKWAKADGDPAPNSSGSHTSEHCPLCSLHPSTIPLPAASVTWGLVRLPTKHPRMEFSAALRRRQASASQQARAPPLTS